MDSMRRMNAYVKLNFQRCLSQGKTLVICICLAVFFYLYFGDVRGGLMESGQKIGIMEMFLVVTNNMYTSFTIWIGFVLIICDIPYRDDGVYQYLLRTSRRSWLWGQIVYIVAITVIYFAYIFLLLLLLIVPQITFQTAWTTTFVKMINAPFGYGISNYFSFPVSVMRQTTALQLFGRCIVLCMMIGMATGFLTMMLHMLWPCGPGIAIGGIGIAMDYWATVVRVGVTSKYLLFISPFSMSRVGNLSTTAFNRVNPTFSYACLFLAGMILVPLAVMNLKIGRYDYS